MKKFAFLALAMCFGATLFAQSISPEQLKEIRESFVKDQATMAAWNAISHNTDIDALAKNLSCTRLDDNFKYRVTPLKSSPDQYTSGRCWLFASLNGIRHYAIDKFDVDDFRFSNNYDAFWNLFEKANLFLEGIISTRDEDAGSRAVFTLFKNPVADGGVWNMFVNIAEKYGVVPESVMPETAHSKIKARLPIINRKLRREGMIIRDKAAAGVPEKELRAYKIEALKDVYRLLVLFLGEPPVEFTWDYQDRTGARHTVTSTPQAFYRSIVPADFGFSTKVMIMNDPTREYYKVYEIENYTDVIEGTPWRYLNLPNEEIKPGILEMIKNDEPVYVSGDWHKYMSKPEMTMSCDNYDYNALFGVNFDMDKRSRILSRYSASAHAMLIVACDTDANDKPLKWQFFNSWYATGEKTYLNFTDEWFDEYMFRMVVDRKYLSKKAQKALDTKPVLLPAWDYMF